MVDQRQPPLSPRVNVVIETNLTMPSSQFVYLASQSPRRRQLLEQLGVRYELLLADDTEDAEALEVVLPGEAPRAYVQRVTLLKLDAALSRMKHRGLPLAPVLCSDTTVALGKTILGKPDDAKHASQILNQLSGQTHRVLTSVAMGALTKTGAVRKQVQGLSVSQVRFAPLTRTQIQSYVASGEPMGKAGAYAVQGRAAAYIAHISGSYSGIMGLPMFETAQLLREFGFKV
jgi:septum formation protein